MLPLLFPLPFRIALFRSLKELFGESKVRDEHRRKQQDGQPYDEHPASRRPHVSRHIRDERELFAVHSDNVPVAERPCVLTRRCVAFGEVDLLAVHRLRSHDTVGDEFSFVCAGRRTEDNDVSLLRSAVIGVKEQDVSRLYRGSHAPRAHREDDVAQDGIALIASDVLLLDEPTNHLDISTISWLEEYLARQSRTLVFISHDRAFVRRLATRMAELDRAKIYSYDCGFDAYLERREERLHAEDMQNAVFDKKLAQEEAWIRQGIKARRTRNMGRVRELMKMREERAARRERTGTATLNVQEAEKSGRLVAEMKDVSFTWLDGYKVFEGASLIIQRGDKIGLIGDNGAGKTTFLRVLLGELPPTSGTVRLGTGLEIAYFDQLRDSLDDEKSVMDNVAEGNDRVTINGEPRHVASYLQDFLFGPDRLRTPVGLLSGGERNRLLLAKLFTRPSNLLVLDEPTNDLDAETLELLEEMLSSYKGTVIVVSHDRAFLDELVTGTIALEGDGRVREYVGGYTDWLRQRGRPEDKKPASSSRETWKENAPRKRRLSYKEQREQEALQKEQAELPARLEALEKEQKKLEKDLADPDLFSRDPEAFNAMIARLPKVEEEQLALLERSDEIEARLAELEI